MARRHAATLAEALLSAPAPWVRTSSPRSKRSMTESLSETVTPSDWDNAAPSQPTVRTKQMAERYVASRAFLSRASRDSATYASHTAKVARNEIREPRDWLKTSVNSAAIIPVKQNMPRNRSADIQNATTLQKPRSFGLTNVPTHLQVIVVNSLIAPSLSIFHWSRNL